HQTGRWVSCHGGPHVLLPKEALGEWDPLKHKNVLSIARNDNAALISVGNTQGIVIGGCDVPMSTWIGNRNFDGANVLVPLELSTFSSDELIDEIIQGLQNSAFHADGFTLSVGPLGLTLFAACDLPSSWICSHLDITIRSGVYSVWSSETEIDDDAL